MRAKEKQTFLCSFWKTHFAFINSTTGQITALLFAFFKSNLKIAVPFFKFRSLNKNFFRRWLGNKNNWKY